MHSTSFPSLLNAKVRTTKRQRCKTNVGCGHPALRLFHQALIQSFDGISCSLILSTTNSRDKLNNACNSCCIALLLWDSAPKIDVTLLGYRHTKYTASWKPKGYKNASHVMLFIISNDANFQIATKFRFILRTTSMIPHARRTFCKEENHKHLYWRHLQRSTTRPEQSA